MKRKVIILIALAVMTHSHLNAQEYLGKVVSILGDADITSVTTGKKFVPSAGALITDDHRIRTGSKSYMEILLNDGTKIYLREVSVLNISGLKLQEATAPTRLTMITGKIRITLKKAFRPNSLVLRTPTTVAGVRGTDFGAIATRNETRLVVFEGKVEVANVRKDILKSFVINEKEEVSIQKDMPPSQPRVVPQEILQSWFEYYAIDESNRIIVRQVRERGILDNLLRKKDF